MPMQNCSWNRQYPEFCSKGSLFGNNLLDNDCIMIDTNYLFPGMKLRYRYVCFYPLVRLLENELLNLILTSASFFPPGSNTACFKITFFLQFQNLSLLIMNTIYWLGVIRYNECNYILSTQNILIHLFHHFLSNFKIKQFFFFIEIVVDILYTLLLIQ